MTDRNPVGRPTDYNTDISLKICEEIAEGKSLNAICKEEDFPSKGTVCRWLASHKEFQDQYAHARELQAEVFADELVSIADDANVEDVQLAKLKIDTRKWVASKLKAKKYGDSTQLKMADHEGNKLEGVDVSFIKVDGNE